MSYALRTGLSFCVIEDRLLFLDIPADRYFCLAPEAERAVGRLHRAEPPEAADQACLARLVQAGLLIDRDDPAGIAPCHALPATQSLIDTPHASATTGGRMAALLSLALARGELRLAGVAGTFARLDRRKQRRQCTANREPIADVAAAFEACNALVSAHDRCLPRSLAIAHRLISIGARPDLVLAVRLAPFKAHAWVQCGTLLVNERLEVTRMFTPILIL